jgi:hypothetical protein
MTVIRWFELSLILACFTTAAVAIVAIRRDKRRHGTHAQPAATRPDPLRVKLWDAFWLWREGEKPRAAISLCFDRQPARSVPAPRDWGRSHQLSAAARTGELAAIGDDAGPGHILRTFDRAEQKLTESRQLFDAAVEETPLPVMRGQVARIGAGIDAAMQAAPWLAAEAPAMCADCAAGYCGVARCVPGDSCTCSCSTNGASLTELDRSIGIEVTPPHAAPDVAEVTHDAADTVIGMRAIPGRTVLREHVAKTMRHTRSPLGAWVDDVLAADVPLVDQELGLLGARLDLREVTRG